MQQAYLDNAATTPLHPEVVEALTNSFDSFANPSSLHRPGADVEKMVDLARADVAKLLKVPPQNLFFTSGGTEANNLAIKGLITKSNRQGRLITSAIEHPSVREVFLDLKDQGWDVVFLSVNSDGKVCLKELERALSVPTLLVSIMAVNNETGVVQPLEEICALVKNKQPKASIHTDAVQAPGKIALNPTKLGVDMVSISAHKIHGPKGIGALYLAKPDAIKPLFAGGGQEKSVRSGTENVLGIVGFARACKLAEDGQGQEHVAKLRQRFVAGLKGLPCQVISPDDGANHILAVSFPGFPGEILLQALSGYNVYVSTGAACSGKKGNLSHVAQALGLDEKTRTGLLRISFSPLNTDDEIDYALDKLKQVVDELAFVRGRSSR